MIKNSSARAGIQDRRLDSHMHASGGDSAHSAGKAKRRGRLAREIAIVLVIKFCALWLIWWVWFSDSAEQEVDGERVGAAIYSSSPRSLSTQKDK